ncbi:MAG: hypothetical protein DRI95_01775 [Bacteroidetes bacterium]|nr:MAG: hypothetical protein DRI95_01775 [Bacteroidota bacterium]
MMKKQKLFLALAFFAMIGISFSACEDDPPAPITGEALFTYEIDGYEVTFTNASSISGTSTYAWDFGDTETSTEKSPVHNYAGKGEYTVTLTVTDEQGGTHPISTKIVVDKSSPIKLDDNSVDDWATITEGFTPAGGEQSGDVLSFKFDYDSENIYFYLKVANTGNWQIYDMLIDVDPATDYGYDYDIFPMFKGAELLIEGGFSDNREGNEDYWVSWSPWNKDGTEWDDGDTDESIWPIDEAKQTEDYMVDGAFIASGSFVEFEFSISRTNIDLLKTSDLIEICGW